MVAKKPIYEIRGRVQRRTKLSRRGKCWAQVFAGVVLGLTLGFLMETNLMGHTRPANETCLAALDAGQPGGPVAQPFIKPGLNEDPYKIIGFEDPTITIENSQQSLVFVGVMTAQKYLATRAVAVYDTWGRELPGRIAFFSSQVSEPPDNRKDLPLVRLRNVDDSYPPQKKSFMMLQYMWDNYGDKFEWFIRADDDVYIRHDKLEHFLRSMDSRKALFIGQAGRGNQEEFGLLSLEYDENFCMGGPGVIMSRETLSRVAPHIKYCLKNLYTTHEDVELGRCVRKFAQVSCTWSYEMQSILYHNSSGYDAFTTSLKQKEVHRAITLHPVKQYPLLYKIHSYMWGMKIQELQHRMVQIHRDMREMTQLLHLGTNLQNVTLSPKYRLFPNKLGAQDSVGDTTLLGLLPSLNKYRGNRVQDILVWDFIQRSMFSVTNLNPRRRVESPYREGIDDVLREMMEMINQYSRQRGRVIEYQDLLYGYFRLNPIHGTDYILDMLLKYKKYRGRKMTLPVRRHAYLQQQFTGMEIRETLEGNEVKVKQGFDASIEELNAAADAALKDVFETSLFKLKQQFPILDLDPMRQYPHSQSIKNKVINFILPLAGRYDTFLRFMSNYEEVCLNTEDNTALVIILFPSKKEPSAMNRILRHVKSVGERFPNAKFKVVPVVYDFARAVALEMGATYCKDDDLNILFFIDVDIVFTKSALERIRLNTIRDKQVYFPVVYSQFDPTVVYENNKLNISPNNFLINSDTGYWRQFGFGIVSLYKKDLRKVGGFDTTIQGWGKEDVDLYDKFVAFSLNMTVFRAVDPGLVHVFHIVDCDPNLEPTQLKMCRGTRGDTYGSVNRLASLIYNKDSVFKFSTVKKPS